MRTISEKSRIRVDWYDNTYNYTDENKQMLKALIAKRYNIDKSRINYFFHGVTINEKGERVPINANVINDIRDPHFQQDLFKQYIADKKVENVDFTTIETIDKQVNSFIDFTKFDGACRYAFKWIEWDYFLSYGPNNRLNFEELTGLVLLNGEPANQSGKTTFAIDLLEFTLFGKTSRPFDKLSNIFNRFCNDNKTVNIKSCLVINNEEYIIQRTLTRSKKRGVQEWGEAKQEVKYYKLINGIEEELADSDVQNLNEENNIQTNKIIKESIGTLDDFKMIISATSDTLEKLIGTGDTEKGRLLSRWIGLLPIEKKEEVGKDLFKSYKASTYSSKYNTVDLESEIEVCKSNNTFRTDKITEEKHKLINSQNKISSYEITKEENLKAKREIDHTLIDLNIESEETKLTRIVNEGKNKRVELEKLERDFAALSSIEYNYEAHTNAHTRNTALLLDINNHTNDIRRLETENDNLSKKNVCPVLGSVCDKLTNTATLQVIENNKTKIVELSNRKTILEIEAETLRTELEEYNNANIQVNNRNRIEVVIAKTKVDIANLLTTHGEIKSRISEYQKNKDIIDTNNQIDIAIQNIDAQLKLERSCEANCIRVIATYNAEIEVDNKNIKDKQYIISEMEKERTLLYHWGIYLDMVGKNGVSKMVLRNTLPFINTELKRLLDDVCDFEIEINLTAKNEVVFNILKDGIVAKLDTGSGFEKTAASLAIRHVLGELSNIPKPNFITLDEILGKVAEGNYNNMKNLYEKIKDSYQFIFHVTHIDTIKDWHNLIVSVNKENNISKLKIIN